MTRAPANLLTARALLLAHLGADAAPAAGVALVDPLDDTAVGIVGDPDHDGGYHCGSDRVVSGDYSVVESARDRTGLTLDASALDVGQFRVRTPLGVFDLPHYSRWLVAQCQAGTPDTRDIREVIYSPDGTAVRRWDRLGRRTSGDGSHRWHTHISYHRDAVKAGRDQAAAVRRYFATIGLTEDPDMPTAQEIAAAVWAHPIASPALDVDAKPAADWLKSGLVAERAIAAVRVQLAELAGRDVSEQEIAAALLATLTPAAIAAALPAAVAGDVADLLAARLQA